MKKAIAIRHVHFENLGTLEPLLRERDYEIHYRDAGVHELGLPDLDAPELLVVLGAPIGASDENIYPFLRHELKLIERQLKEKQPLLGICLGAQLLARVMGASVAPMGHKEIGFAPVALTAAGQHSPLACLSADTSVLHWHGDQFTTPNGAENLASTPLCPNQAFSVGNFTLGLQFHLEADWNRIESWLIGHSAELSQARIDPCLLRAQAKTHGKRLSAASQIAFGGWLDRIDRCTA